MRTPQPATKDPICGMSVNQDPALHAERDGKTFYFCGESCKNKFHSLPTESAKKGKEGGCCA